MMVFKMRDSVPSVRYMYSPVCNVLHLWKIWLIPTYDSMILNGHCMDAARIMHGSICSIPFCFIQVQYVHSDFEYFS